MSKDPCLFSLHHIRVPPNCREYPVLAYIYYTALPSLWNAWFLLLTQIRLTHIIDLLIVSPAWPSTLPQYSLSVVLQASLRSADTIPSILDRVLISNQRTRTQTHPSNAFFAMCDVTKNYYIYEQCQEPSIHFVRISMDGAGTPTCPDGPHERYIVQPGVCPLCHG